MKPTFDRNLFTQIGLDSASLTILGSVVHSLGEPGEYRGAVHRGDRVEREFYITADRNSPVAQITIDLAALTGGAPDTRGGEDDCCCGDASGHGRNRFVVNPRGYVLFHVSSGPGGYYVTVRRIDAEPNQRGYDSRVLAEGDVFSAVVIRPGTYAVRNELTKAVGELTVSYPVVGERPYRPPNPVRVQCGPEQFEPPQLTLQPGQGILFDARAPTRIVIELLRADDGPPRPERDARPARAPRDQRSDA